MAQDVYNDLISRGIVLMSSEKYEAALQVFAQAKKEEPKSIQAYIHIGNAYVNMGKYQEGINEFKKGLVIEPDNGVILYSIGSAYLLMGDRLKTVEYYNKAEAKGYKSTDMYQLLALTFFEANDMAQALRNVNRAIALSPLDGNIRLFKAGIYMADGKYEDALQTLDEMNKYLPDAYEAYSRRVDIYLGMKKYDKAMAVAEEGSSRFPEDENLTELKLRVLTESEQFDDALELIEQMKANGQYDKLLNKAAMQEASAYLGKGDADNAISVINSACEKLGKDDDNLLFVLLNTYSTVKKYDLALETAERLLAVTENEDYIPHAKYTRAAAFEELGKAEEAKAEFKSLASEFRKLTIADPSRYDVYIFRLLCHTKLKEYDKALSLADYLESANPESTDAHAFRHYIYKEMGDMEKAEKEKEKVLQINPNMQL